MNGGQVFLMAGGGTGGHVIPALAVARELRRRGHEPVFVGSRTGIEAKLVPAEGFAIEWIVIGGLKRVGLRKTLRTLWQLPASVGRVRGLIRRRRPGAVFSMGGYVAGPVVLAAILSGVPVIAMEPNAMPGMTNRKIGRFLARTLICFPEAARYFPAGKTEVTGLPVRAEFFAIPPKSREGKLTVLITGGSQGSRTLNQAARDSWGRFRQAGVAVRFIHQTGQRDWDELRAAFAQAGLDGELVPFIDDMPKAFAAADLVVCRAGAGAVAELAAAGKPALLVPYPFAADDHQRKNAEAFERAGAAKVVLDQELNGERLFVVTSELAADPGRLERMADAARSLARPGAAERAADLLEEYARA